MNGITMSNLHPTKENCKTKDRGGYPQRQPFFAQKYIRLMLKTCAANMIGQDGFALCIAVVTTEDGKRYRGPVSFHVGQLLPILGFAKWNRLATARERAVGAGWLHYEAPKSGTRAPGLYWGTIPDDAADIPDGPVDEEVGPIEAAYLRGYRDGQAGTPPKLYTDPGYGQEQPYPDKGYGRGYGQGYGRGYGKGDLPILSPIPIPSPRPGQGPDVLSSGNHRRIRQPSYTEADMATAQWIWERIHQMQPGRKTPNFDKWANAVRLMREQDGRTDEEIRALFTRVQADAFWSKNVLSPDTLRSKWDDLQLRLRKTNGKPASQPSIYKPLTPIV